ncbi:MAG TPA: SDR family oxidoreductase [Pseudonocardiaceae bacterium]|nr:SDR family oxidoreductase [Pseudonocardiaceae bacterium]
MNRILVTGATGTVGVNVVRELGERGVAVRVLTRDLRRAACALGDAVEIVRGDFADPVSVQAALRGIERVFVCSPNHPRQVEHETTVIAAAARAGVQLIVKIGAIIAEIGSPLRFADAHARIEEHLRACGRPSVVLRPSFFMSNPLVSLAWTGQAGAVFAPAGEAKLAMIDPRDVATVAAVVLTGDGHEGRTYSLTGPEALTYHDVARELSAVTGRSVNYVGISDSVAREAMVGDGLPEWLADQIVLLWGALRRGAVATTTDVFRALTGHEPRTFADFARDFARPG